MARGPRYSTEPAASWSLLERETVSRPLPLSALAMSFQLRFLGFRGQLRVRRFSWVSRGAFIVAEEGLAYHRGLEPLAALRPRHNLALRLQKRREAVLRFLTDVAVPYTNNQAERDLRMMKLRMKISGCFRPSEVARFWWTV